MTLAIDLCAANLVLLCAANLEPKSKNDIYDTCD